MIEKCLDFYEKVIYAKPPVEIQPALYYKKVDPDKTLKRREEFDDNYRTIRCFQNSIYELTCNTCGKKITVEITKNWGNSSSRKYIDECWKNDEPYICYCDGCKPKNININCKDCNTKQFCLLYDEDRGFNHFNVGIGCMTLHNAKLNTTKSCNECKDEECNYRNLRDENSFAGNFCLTKYHMKNKKQIYCNDCKEKDICLFKNSNLNSFVAGFGCMTKHNGEVNNYRKCIECENKNICKYCDFERETNHFVGDRCMTEHHDNIHNDIYCIDCNEYKTCNVKDDNLHHFLGNLCMKKYHIENSNEILCKDCENYNECKCQNDNLNFIETGIGCMTLHNYKVYNVREKYYCENCKTETDHNGYGKCMVCQIQNKSKLIFCEKCNKLTPHKYSKNTKNLYCECCEGEKIWYENWDRFISREIYNEILENKKELEILHKYNFTDGYYSYFKKILLNENNTLSLDEICKNRREELNDLENERQEKLFLLEKYNFSQDYLGIVSSIASINSLSFEQACQKKIEINQRKENEKLEKENRLSIMLNYKLSEDLYSSIIRLSTMKSISFEKACILKKSYIDAESLCQKQIALIAEYGFSSRRLNPLLRRANQKGLSLEDYMKTLVWCNNCQQFEDPEYNAITEHWKNGPEFFLCRIWMNEHQDEVNFLESNIIGFDKLLDGKVHCGIYRWYIDYVPYYYGQSVDIFRRSHEYFMNIVDYSEYWLDIFNAMKNGITDKNGNKHTLSIEFTECDEVDLDDLERYYILRDLPVTQLCTNDGKCDNIIHLEDREFDSLDNLSLHYFERIMTLDESIEDVI